MFSSLASKMLRTTAICLRNSSKHIHTTCKRSVPDHLSKNITNTLRRPLDFANANSASFRFRALCKTKASSPASPAFYSAAANNAKGGGARRVLQAQKARASKRNRGMVGFTLGSAVMVVGGGYYLLNYSDAAIELEKQLLPGEENNMYDKFWTLWDETFADHVESSRSVLLPPFPAQHIPPGHKAPRTLVLDLENTLIRYVAMVGDMTVRVYAQGSISIY